MDAPGREGAPESPSPGAAPMSTPQPPEGDQMAAIVELVGAINVIDRQILKFEPGSKEARALLKARKSLTKITGKQEDEGEELSPALKKMYLAELLGPSSPPPQQPPTQAGPGVGAQPLGPGAPLGGMAPQ